MSVLWMLSFYLGSAAASPQVSYLTGGPAPGSTSTILSVGVPTLTRDGQVVLTGSLANGERVLWIGDEIVFQSSFDYPSTTFIDAIAAGTDDHDYAIALHAGGEHVLLTADGILQQIGEPTPGAPGLVSFLEAPQMSTSGNTRWRASVDGVSVGLWRNVGPHVGLGLSDSDTLGSLSIVDGLGISNDYDLAGGGRHLIQRILVEDPVTLYRDAVILDGAGIALQDTSAPDGGTWQELQEVAVDNRGTWAIVGETDLSEVVVVVDGVAAPLTGLTIDGYTLQSGMTVEGLSLNERGMLAIAWGSAFLDGDAAILVACDVHDLPGSLHTVLRLDDELDVDNDNATDWWVQTVSNAPGDFADSLADDGSVHVAATLRELVNSLSSEDAIVRMDNPCDCSSIDSDSGSQIGTLATGIDTCAASNDYTDTTPPSSCSNALSALDHATTWRAPADGDYVFSANGIGPGARPNLRVLTGTCVPEELACGSQAQSLTVSLQKGEVVTVVVQGQLGCGTFSLQVDGCPGDDDDDGVCDTDDVCIGDDLLGDADQDGICDDLDLCLGDDTTDDVDLDGVCADLDPCFGEDSTGDYDGDGVCADLDACWGADDSGDSDGDGFCDSDDLCVGDDTWGDRDADGLCDDTDFWLDTTRVVPTLPMTLRAHNAPVGSRVDWFVTLQGLGDEPCVGGECGTLAAPIRIGRVTVPPSGVAQLSLVVPASLPTGRFVYFQAVAEVAGTAGFSQVQSRRTHAP